MTVRAKFKVDEVIHNTQGGRVRLSPVVGGSKENEAFFKWTPSGNIDMGTINPNAMAQFHPGDEFFVDFTFSPKEPKI